MKGFFSSFTNYMNYIVGAIGGSIAYFFGGQWESVKVLCIFIILDIITGYLKGYVTNALSSKTGFKGFIKKTIIFVVLIVAVEVDKLTKANGMFVGVASYFYIANEGLSIIENCTTLGLPVPNVITKALEQIKDKSVEDDKK